VPGLFAFVAERISGLRPGTSLRRRLIGLQVSRGFAAMARSDLDVVLLAYEPDAEVWMSSMAGVGISDCYRGHEGVRALYADIDDAFDAWWWAVRKIADGGDRLAVRADFVGYGRGSGVKTSVSDAGTAIRLSRRGLVAWQEWFPEQGGWSKALHAVGLSEGHAPAQG
jgi:hypothetical protein